MLPRDDIIRRSRTACLPCRTSKRRCDRVLPSCSLCVRREAECRYSHRRFQYQSESPHNEWAGSTTATAAGLLAGTRDDNEVQSRSSLTMFSEDTRFVANAVYFIAPQLHLQAQLELPRPTLAVPAGLSPLVDKASSIHSIASAFFATIHPWLPIISKEVFYKRLLNPLAGRRTELSLLTLSMKLCCTIPADEEGERAVKTSLYDAVKRFHYDVEGAGLLSIHVLQAGLLIALYELGQAIYPAAYLTVGACARYGLAMGVNVFSTASPTNDHGLLSWNEIEERRRVWWAVRMFDRFLSLSNTVRPLSTDDPTFDTYLPVDDAIWDEGTSKPADASLISTGFTLKMGLFARMAQAAFLASQALELIKHPWMEDEATRTGRMAQIRRASLALVHTTDAEASVRRLEFCAQSGLSFSTILLLQDYNLHNVGNHGQDKMSFEDLWEESRTALDRLSAASASHYINSPHEPHASDPLPIFMIHVLYLAACTLMLLAPDTLTPKMQEDAKIFRSVLHLINLRWRLAGIYLTVLDSRETSIIQSNLDDSEA